MPSKPAPSASLYDVHPSVSYARAILDNLPAKTGRSLQQWIALLREEGPAGEKERRAWLQKEHKLGGTTAWMIAARADGKGADDTDPEAYLRYAAGYVEAMYSGPRTGLRPIHDALVALGRSLGSDVKVCPCQTIVPLYRDHVFAEIKPAANTRIDLGFALKGAKRKPTRRFLDAGGLAKGDRITHRIPIGSLDEIDAEVREGLKTAYDLDG